MFIVQAVTVNVDTISSGCFAKATMSAGYCLRSRSYKCHKHASQNNLPYMKTIQTRRSNKALLFDYNLNATVWNNIIHIHTLEREMKRPIMLTNEYTKKDLLHVFMRSEE